MVESMFVGPIIEPIVPKIPKNIIIKIKFSLLIFFLCVIRSLFDFDIFIIYDFAQIVYKFIGQI